MRNPRTWEWKRVTSVACLCAPTLAVVAFCAWFMVDKVPDLIRAEHKRVIAEYRQVALNLQSRTNELERVALGKGWKPTGRMKPGKWGVEIGSADKAFVWYEDDAMTCGTDVDVIPETDFSTIFWIVGSFVLVLLSGMTAFGVKFFLDYIRARDDFLAATAHDLTTPLVGMRYAIGCADDEAKVLNERMLRLVDNIKDFLKIGGKRPAARCEKFDIAKAYDEAYALFRGDYRDIFDGADVPVENCGAPNVCADETLTIQILWNLLGNDLKYAAPYGSVRVRFSEENGFVKIEFIDEGKGMTPRQLRRAFDRYYRAKTVLESGKGGFGIGLCTAREFANAMGGSLVVCANKPHGCIFTLRLPAAK